MNASLIPAVLDGGRRYGEGALDLAAVEAVAEVDGIPAADAQIAGHVPVGVLPGEVDAAHVRAVAVHLCEPGAAALLAGFDQLDHVRPPVTIALYPASKTRPREVTANMFEFLTANPAVVLLKEDHDRVKELFDRFEAAKSRPAKVKIVRAALTELKVHAAVEEELFYPAVRAKVGKEVMNEADEEHHVAKLLVAELDKMDGSESHFDAKFTVLAENVRHHIKEEEGEMLPKARTVKLDFAELAEKMATRKETLLAGGVPPAGEEAMVKASRGKGDSPARAARRKAPKLPRRRS